MTRKELFNKNREELNKLVVANERLYKETAWSTGVSPKQVEEIVSFVQNYSANIIRTGCYETIMLPNFGKFKIKPKHVQMYELIVNNKKQNETI